MPPRLHGELLKLGIEISERTVSRLLRTVPRPPSQSWKIFLQNHIGELVATDFFTVPTVRLRVLFGLGDRIIMEQGPQPDKRGAVNAVTGRAEC